MPSYADPETIAQAVLAHLARQQPAGAPWRLGASPRVRQMLWSTLYFLTVADAAGAPHPLVVKIAHFPDQETPEISWQSEELLLRGRREFESMARLFAHFNSQPDSLLRALRPHAYLPEINAIVMDYADGVSLYDGYVAMRHLWTRQGRRRAAQMLRRAGKWLRWLHSLPLDDVPPGRLAGPADSLQAMRAEVDALREQGVNPAAWPLWEPALEALRRVSHDERVWVHSDFHLRNVLVLPGGGVLGFDTALDQADSPYYDLGKLVADLQTRRARVLRWGLLPPAALVQSLTRAFLQGYFDGAPPAALPLALYEGRFLFEKWSESLAVLQALAERAAPLSLGLRRLIVDPTFHRLVRQWMSRVTAAAVRFS